MISEDDLEDVRQCIPAFGVLFGGRSGCDTCGHGEWNLSRCVKWIKSAASASLVQTMAQALGIGPQSIVLLFIDDSC